MIRRLDLTSDYRQCAAEPTLLYAEVGHDEDDCVAGEDVVPAVHERPVDGEDGDHPGDDQQRRDVLPARLLRALVPGV